MKNRKPITSFLIVTFFGIWGSIAYQIVNALDSDDNQNLGQSRIRDGVTQQIKEPVKFDETVRDPFRYAPIRKRSSIPRPSELWVPPPLRLTGIVVRPEKTVAVLESSDGATYFLSEGDTTSGVKLLKILDGKVRYRYRSKTSEWALN